MHEGAMATSTSRSAPPNGDRRQTSKNHLKHLSDREGLSRLLGHALSWRRQPGPLVAVLYLDIDRFRDLNDRLGRRAGDDLLRQFAARVSGCLRSGDSIAQAWTPDTGTVARLGSDEFVAVLTHVDRPEGAASVARRMLDALDEAFPVAGLTVSLRASIGIAVQPPDGDDPAGLVARAESAMHLAKAKGRSSFRFYHETLTAALTPRVDLETQLREALARREFSLCYQPLVDSRTETLVGVEALLRWNRPEHQPMSPAEFVPVAEESGLIVALGEWVLRCSCHQMKAWLDEGLPPVQLSVNLSGHQLREGDFAAAVAEVLEETGLASGLLQIELTESGVITQDVATVSQLQKLKDLGVSIAIDDFGTGYSALGYLRRFPVDVIKIDRSFVGAISASPDDAAFVSAVIAMARRLDLTVVAEGVETAEQLSFLRENACDLAQGFLFSKPVPPEEFRALLSREAARGVAQGPPQEAGEPLMLNPPR
jgi:diguanylate cyclase (GGDEF)-like protein